MTTPQPVPTVAKVTVIMDWIESLGWDVTQESGYPMYPGPEVTDIGPARALFITPTPGPGWLTEEAAMDCWGFQARLRGPDDDPVMPSLMMQRLDVLILNAPTPVVIDGQLIQMVTRSGGTPSPLPLDPSGRRFEYTCTYLITTGLE